MLKWRRRVFMCHLPRKISPLKAIRLCFLPLGFRCWLHLASPCPGGTVPAGSAAEACLFHPHASFLMGTRTLARHYQKATLLWLPTDAIPKLLSLYPQVRLFPHGGYIRVTLKSVQVTW